MVKSEIGDGEGGWEVFRRPVGVKSENVENVVGGDEKRGGI